MVPFWYQLTWVVPDKGPLNGSVCVCDKRRRTCCLVEDGVGLTLALLSLLSGAGFNCSLAVALGLLIDADATGSLGFCTLVLAPT